MKTRTFTGTTSQEVQLYETEHRAVARRAAADGIVLLKNEGGLLPLSVDTTLAAYGAGAGHTIKGGTGSGDVNERYSVSIAEGLVNAGYCVTTKDWLDDYDAQFTAARQQWKDDIWAEADRCTGSASEHLFNVYSSMPFRYPTGDLDIIKTEADVAIYVLSRVAGEGADRYNEAGDYYLDEEEMQLLSKICALYPKVILVLNTGGQVDLSFTDEYKNISAILQISQLGCEGGNAVADVLSGKVTPGGKLSSTWAWHYEDYPNSKTFSHNNGNVKKEFYTEGIYVGYRYFDTFQVPVRYGFGYGLSYTAFAITLLGIDVRTAETGKPELHMTVSVTNTGVVYSGKEVVQVYVSCPQGKLEKEYRRLTAFAKTNCLAPGEEQTLELYFPLYALASYCEAAPGWVLEQGVYGIFLGNSLESAELAGSLMLAEDHLLVKTQTICPVRDTFEELQAPAGQVEALREKWMSQTASLPQITLSKDSLATETIAYGGEYQRIPKKVRDFVDSLSEEQLILLATGDPGQGQGSNLGSSGISVPGSAAQTSTCAHAQGLADIVLADGPAGLRLLQDYTVKDGEIVPSPFEKSLEGGFLNRETQTSDGETYYQYCTAFPVGTALAQTWDTDMIVQVGKAVANEMQQYKITSWLAPGMNIQRNPLCGRNFEYFSEDPLLSGKLAAAMTDGVQSEHGCGATIKHFACNNQEDNRMASDSVLSERTLREIYLKGFEIAIKEAQPMMIMTSYNLVNGVHAANNYDLCTKAARDEWGFRGFIMTDWTTTHNGPDCTASGCMRAGNDIVMPGIPNDHENMRRELAEGTLDLKALKTSICHIVQVVWQSNMYE